MEATEIRSKIRGIIAGMFDVNPAEVSDSKSFKEMAKYDSMRALEFLAKLENEFDVMIEPDLLQKMQSVEQSVQVIEGLLRAK